MKWLAAEVISSLMPFPPGYRFEPMHRADVREVIAAIKSWHPKASVGAASCYLREDFYHDRVCLDGDDRNDTSVIRITHQGELAGLWSVEREVDSLAIYGRLVILAPDHRGANLSSLIMKGSENVSRAMGAAFQYAMATLENPLVQRALESGGYQLLGFFPGYDREEVSPGVVKRVYQAVYAKLLVSDEEVQWPDRKNLTPKALQLFDLLFPAAG